MVHEVLQSENLLLGLLCSSQLQTFLRCTKLRLSCPLLQPCSFWHFPKDDSDSWSSAVLSPCSIIAGFGLDSWEMSSAFNRDKAGWYLQSPSHPLYWPRSVRLTDKYSCKDSKVSFPLQEYCSKPLKSGVHQSCLLCPELPRVEI